MILSIAASQLVTRNPTSKLELTILARVATWEPEAMLERQREGIAKAAGKYKGRPVSVDAAHVEQLKGHVASRCDREASLHARSSGYSVLA